MKRASISTRKHHKNSPAEDTYQSSRSRYMRAFSSARAMRFWRPRVTAKELTVAAVFAAAIAITPTAQAQFPASIDLSTLDGNNGFVINGIDEGDGIDYSVSGAGDVNGDGIDDVIIGASLVDGNGNSASVESYVVFGRAAHSGVLKGDVDMDGDIDFDDIGPFIAVLQSGDFQAEADCDCSTVVDFADIPAFIALLQQQ